MSTILIIDDHPAFRMIVRLQLMQLLSVEEVVEADNGQTAVEMARQYKPDLAILDLDIPRISGLDVIPRLKLVHPPIRVMVLSGHDPATFAPRAMRSGVHGFVGKSQEMKEIMRGVEAVLAGYTVFPAERREHCAGRGIERRGRTHHAAFRQGTRDFADAVKGHVEQGNRRRAVYQQQDGKQPQDPHHAQAGRKVAGRVDRSGASLPHCLGVMSEVRTA